MQFFYGVFAENNHMKSYGYTLIELMLAISIIGLFIFLAMPVYQQYVARAQLAEAINLIQPLKIEIHSFVDINGRLPNTDEVSSRGMIGSVASHIEGHYIEKGNVTVAANSGQITVPCNSGYNAGYTLTLLPHVTSENKVKVVRYWTCGGSVPSKNLPSMCR